MAAVVFYRSHVDYQRELAVLELLYCNVPVLVLHAVEHPLGLTVEPVFRDALAVDSVWHSLDGHFNSLYI